MRLAERLDRPLLIEATSNQVNHHGGYTGISIGWNWGYQRSISRDNIVAYNHIHDIGQGLLSDMGASTSGDVLFVDGGYHAIGMAQLDNLNGGA